MGNRRARPERMVLAEDVVGRDAELADLRAALTAARHGDGAMWSLVGEPGIGKSRLVRALATDAAASGVRVLQGRAVQGPGMVAFRPLAEALTAAVRAGIAPDPAALGPFRANLARLVPDWRDDALQPLDESLVAVGEAVLRFLGATAGEHGAVLVLEDLHWSDPETATVVEYLSDHVGGERILVLATTRDRPSPGLDLARSLAARRAAHLLELAPLGRSAVHAMVASCLSSPDVPDDVLALVARAEGVPFVVEELLAAALASGSLFEAGGSWRTTGRVDAVVPHDLAANIHRRIRGLGTACEHVLTAAAVLGRHFAWELLPAMTGLEREAVLAALHDAVDAHVVTFDRASGDFRFRHALSRDAVLDGLFPPELATLCRRGLAAVEGRPGDLGAGEAELAAELALGAGDRERAAKLFLAAAHEALEQGALASAEAVLERARALAATEDATRVDIDECLLQVVSLSGKRDRAVELAASLLRRLGAGPEQLRRRVEIHLRLARAALAASQWEQVDELLDRAVEELAGAGSHDRLAAELQSLRAQRAIVRDPARARQLAEPALAAADRLGLPNVACEALEVLGRSHRQDDLEAAEEAFARALAVAEGAGLTVWRARALQELGAIDMLRGRPLDRLQGARDLAMAHGALATVAVVDVQLAAGLVIGDTPDVGAEVARRSAEVSRRHGLDQTAAAAVALEAYAHARAGRRDDVQRCIDEARARAPGAADIEVKAATAAAVLALVEEDRATARRHLCGGLGAVVRAGGDCSVVPGIGVLALLRAVDGGDDATPEVPVPHGSVHFLAASYLRFAGAVHAGRGGDVEAARAHVEAAVQTLGDLHWFRHLALRLVAEAAIEDGWGEPVPWLRAALHHFEEHDDDRLASACRALLRRAGAPVPRRRGGTAVPGALGAVGVTAREVEVLRLLALGMPNSEIAARLFISPRTVERHVSNLTVKTGCERRAELVAYAVRAVGEVSEH